MRGAGNSARGMPALGARSFVRPAADVGAVRAGRFARTQSPADSHPCISSTPTSLRPRPRRRYRSRSGGADDERLYLSAVTVAEIGDGIAMARRERAGRKAGGLTAWPEALLHLHADRILAFDVTAAHVARTLSDFARSKAWLRKAWLRRSPASCWPRRLVATGCKL
jgi:predicted nucleic acid-binding protein